jgi:hypothetical protein
VEHHHYHHQPVVVMAGGLSGLDYLFLYLIFGGTLAGVAIFFGWTAGIAALILGIWALVATIKALKRHAKDNPRKATWQTWCGLAALLICFSLYQTNHQSPRPLAPAAQPAIEQVAPTAIQSTYQAAPVETARMRDVRKTRTYHAPRPQRSGESADHYLGSISDGELIWVYDHNIKINSPEQDSPHPGNLSANQLADIERSLPPIYPTKQ